MKKLFKHSSVILQVVLAQMILQLTLTCYSYFNNSLITISTILFFYHFYDSQRIELIFRIESEKHKNHENNKKLEMSTQ